MELVPPVQSLNPQKPNDEMMCVPVLGGCCLLSFFL